MNFIKNNILSGLTLILVAYLILSGGSFGVGGTTNFDSLELSENLTTTGNLTISGTSTLTGTTTVAQSVDGLVVGGTVTSVGTTSSNLLYTNTTGPKHCDSSVGYVRRKSTGFAPSLNISMGTTTGSNPTLNLLATTTTATSSSETIATNETVFELDNGESIYLMIGDSQGPAASSTYYSNIQIEAGIWCQDSSI